MHEFGGTGEVSDVFCAVAVAGEDDRDVVFAAAAQDLAVVGSGVSSVAVGGEGGFVDFKDHSEFFCCDCKCLIICWKMRIIAMSEDFDAGMLHSVQVRISNIVKEIDKTDNFNVARAYICVKNDKIEIEKW